MSKFGIIFTCYNMQEFVDQSLSDLIKARQSKLDNNEFYIVAVSLPFKDFPITNCDNTIQILQTLKNNNLIDELITEPKFIKETEARTLALQKIINNGCEYSMMIDCDEFINLNQISNILKFIQFNNLITWFKLSYRNFVFDTNTYLVEPFTPPRIHKLKFDNYIADSFYEDNNIIYRDLSDDKVVYIDKCFSNMLIPSNIALISHLAWLNNSRSKSKVAYQEKRWGTSSYKWDEKNNKLIFNNQYFEKLGKPLPQTAQLSTTLG